MTDAGVSVDFKF